MAKPENKIDPFELNQMLLAEMQLIRQNMTPETAMKIVTKGLDNRIRELKGMKKGKVSFQIMGDNPSMW